MDFEDPLEARLQEELEDYGVCINAKTKEKVLSKCSELCSKYGVTVEDFVVSWLAFAATKGFNEVGEGALDEFETNELSEQQRERNKNNLASLPAVIKLESSQDSDVQIYGKSKPNGSCMDVDSDDNEVDPVLETYGGSNWTPKADRKTKSRFRPDLLKNNGGSGNKGKENIEDFSPSGFSPAIEAKSTSYAARSKAGDSVLRYKCKDSDYWNELPEGRELVKVFPSQCTSTFVKNQHLFKYMIQKTSNMASALNAVISETGLQAWEKKALELQAVEKNELEPEAAEEKVLVLQDLRETSTEGSWYLGRIRSEDGRLAQGHCYLEGDLDISGGHIIPLDISNVEEYRLFPGQIVLIKGTNEVGRCLRVIDIFVPPSRPSPQILPKTTRPINVIAACGPYTPSDSLQCEPLKDLLEVIKRDKPDLCLLMGPFIDPAHPMIANGEVADTFDDMFENIVKKITHSLEDVQTHIIFIPSYKDAHHHNVYPTLPYTMDSNIKTEFFPDPAIFEVAGITFGVTCTDILKHLANSEIAKSTIADRMGGLSKLILSQGNMYPLQPPDESVPLDIELWKQYCRFTETPHILIMPSDLRYFIKDVDNTIVVNPERLTKGRSGGTYARLQINIPEQAVLDEENQLTSVADFCYGEIMKI